MPSCWSQCKLRSASHKPPLLSRDKSLPCTSSLQKAPHQYTRNPQLPWQLLCLYRRRLAINRSSISSSRLLCCRYEIFIITWFSISLLALLSEHQSAVVKTNWLPIRFPSHQTDIVFTWIAWNFALTLKFWVAEKGLLKAPPFVIIFLHI